MFMYNGVIDLNINRNQMENREGDFLSRIFIFGGISESKYKVKSLRNKTHSALINKS